MNYVASVSGLVLIAASAVAGNVAPAGGLQGTSNLTLDAATGGPAFQYTNATATPGVTSSWRIQVPASRAPVLGGSSIVKPLAGPDSTGRTVLRIAPNSGLPTPPRPSAGEGSGGPAGATEQNSPPQAGKFTPDPSAGFRADILVQPPASTEVAGALAPNALPGPGDSDRSPLTVPLPSGVTMGLLGLASLVVVARRRAQHRIE